MKQRKIFILFVISIFVSSCSTVLNSPKIDYLTSNYCQPTIEYDYSKLEVFPNKTSNNDSILKANLSQHDILISKAIGIESYLSEYLQTKKDTLKRLVLKQKITDRLILTSIEINALASELDCNGERIDKLANFVNDINNKKTRNLTVASVTIGALTTVATVLIKNNNASDIVGVSGGLVSAGLGALTIAPKGKKINLKLERNLLRNIWFNDNSNGAYPNSIWVILNEKQFSNSGKNDLQESIKNRWLQYNFDGKIDAETEKLFFYDGGIYSADDLSSRANMLNELQATVRSLEQDLKSLSVRLNSI
ncbi:hypothetical protein SOM12_12465 [Flavobacterium sp. CFBP9031]|uniref:hypothetical protein n=1 Tax=Flavobacterium sp. CFBP9031 TaxID=3096538 RepID=UPI002A69CEF0|nr:hypothetical protein [Flavobacterium sp. CFBP9031]MDY0988231.1 hypothetical protein [Flavobacterium sp. CFBP9031]